jgi:POT family proton-dependent oligopeptide transporter
VNNSANSFFVISFAAIFGLMWVGLNRKKLEPNTVSKFGIAFLCLAAGFYVFYYTRFFSDANGVTSLDVFTAGWFIITLGELCLSPIGMSIMTKLAPLKLQGVMMGMWFLASAYGQYIAGLLGANISNASKDANNYEKMLVYTDGYKQLGLYSLILGLGILICAPFIKKLMAGVK